MKKLNVLMLVLLLLFSAVPLSTHSLAEATTEPAATPTLMNFTLFGTPEEGIERVASGSLDLLLSSYPLSTYNSLPGGVIANLSLYRTALVYNELSFNTYHDPDKDAPIVTVGDQVYFNPFAIREVRFAMNWLVNREYIVNDIRAGSGEPMFGCVRPTHPADVYFEPVYRSLGIPSDGNVYYALDVFNDAMLAAVSQVSTYGHTLERRADGFWYFDGQPVTIKFIIRIEDERRQIGDYVADLIENYLGFHVERLYWDRNTAGSVVFNHPPSDYEWNIYTGGWASMGLPSVWVDSYTAWFYGSWFGFVPGGVEPRHENTLTVREALEYIGSGDASLGLSMLEPMYYTTLDVLGPILNWTEEELTYLLIQYSISRSSVSGTPHLHPEIVPDDPISITSEEQYWDIQKLSMLVGILESPRIFLMENTNFYPASRGRVESITAEPNTGISTRWSLMTASTPDGTLNVGMANSFVTPANPVGGMRDLYSASVLNLVTDPGASMNFNGRIAPYRCSWTVENGPFTVPGDAVVYDQNEGWVPRHAGEEANVRVTVSCDLGSWHNGITGDIDDIKNYVAFLYAWSQQDGHDDSYYDASVESRVDSVLNMVKGFQWTADGYVAYGTYMNQLDENVTASYYVFYPSLPWELYWAMGELVADGAAYGVSANYSFSSSGEGVIWLDLLNSSHVADLRTVISAIASGSAAHTFPGIDWSSATARFNADMGFSDTYGHLFIGNGPYYIESYTAEPFNVVLRAFDAYPVTRAELMTFLTGHYERADVTPPSIVDVNVSPESQEVGNFTTISWVASDDSGLANVTLEITDPSGTPLRVELDPSIGVYSYDYTIPAVGTYTARIVVEDTYGNVREVGLEFYGKESLAESLTVNGSTGNVTVSTEGVELGIDVNESVEGEQTISVNVTITTNEGELAGENVSGLAVATTGADETVAPVKYVAVSVEANESTVEKYTLNVSYTDGEVAGIDESTLSLYYWNGSEWIRLRDYVGRQVPNGPFVYDAGVNTVENYVWAVVDHFSVYALGGLPVPSVEIISPEDGEVFYTNTTANVTVEWSGQDELAVDHYEIRLNDGEWINVGLSTEYTFHDLEQGKYEVYVKAVNIAGNENTTSVSFTVSPFKRAPPARGKGAVNVIIKLWTLYRYREMKFEELYTEAVEAGVDNETLGEAMEYATLAREYYQEALTYGEPPQKVTPLQIRPLLLAYLNMNRAVEILERALG
ncbi:triple tyrosine motif-containing protein [Palaeococcus ferrophilus]|uniref:triple tyrosine motif-containing protein n=1 Tax=Palaeococcus ferrophilus TaxID=83868 RepID=UPI000697095E|nr:triple tyrosine motif-containing protein [Palaeococcus ferrophilus]